MSKRCIRLRVGHLDDRGPSFIELPEELHDFFRLIGVKIARGLIGQDELRFVDHRARYTYQLLLSAGQLVGIEVFLPDDVEAVERVAYQAVTLGFLNIFVRQWQVDQLD